MKTSLSRRLYSALLLPLRPDLKIDESGLRNLIRQHLKNPIFKERGGLVANPEAGEIYYLTRAEKQRVLEIVLEETNGLVPVIAGTFGWTTSDTVDGAKDAKQMGAQGLFVSPPAGSMDVSSAWDPLKYPEVWLDQILEQDRATDLPIFVHPVVTPSQPWGIGLPLQAALRYCREVPNIVGWKTTYAYPGHRILSRAFRQSLPDVALLCSSAQFFHEYLATGCIDGTITGSWNYGMEPMLAHMAAWERNDANAARALWDSGLAELQEYIYAEPGRLHVRYKVASWLRGWIDSPVMRPPMPAPRLEEIQTIAARLAACGIEVRSGAEVNAVATSRA
ncbi:dihydrodipicolinate synthase family protein [Variovorax terrae]|uniref:Dihydrodipicolinate synthase family protein n=1 Tax=Variovorax terrae TaxID=2923278 RepID=A0A9X1W0U6_9BURK|nr:dihydrodipicolinate synthase family protein [Variovorax terrae]MCJ0764033.1 dihydrodipicolinate synthase family protein [Variovorax terrae]